MDEKDINQAAEEAISEIRSIASGVITRLKVIEAAKPKRPTESDYDRMIRVKATIADVRAMADGWGIPPKDVLEKKWYSLVYDTDRFEIGWIQIYQYVTGRFWFASVESAEHCIDTIGQDRLTEVFMAGECL